MKKQLVLIECLLFAALIFSANAAVRAQDEGYAVPRMKSIQVDGLDSEWNAVCFRGKLFCDVFGRTPSVGDLSADFRLAWHPHGLCVFVRVSDDSVNVAGNGDNVEFFMSEGKGGKNKIQWIVTPLSVADTAGVVVWDHRGSRSVAGKPIADQFAVRHTQQGYNIEALLPFSNIGVRPASGSKAGFELVVNDAESHGSQQMQWGSLDDAYLNNYALTTLRLTDYSADSSASAFRCFVIDESRAVFNFVGDTVYLSEREIVVSDSLGWRIVLPLSRCGHYAQAADTLTTDELDMMTPKQVECPKRQPETVDMSIVPLQYKHMRPPPSAGYIRLLEMQERHNPSPEHPIIFIGHSMFRYWNTFADDMKGFPAVNKAFGGSQAYQINQYFDRLILPLTPSAIVYYTGSNDARTGKTADEVMREVEWFVQRSREAFPGVKIFFTGYTRYHLHRFVELEKVQARMVEMANAADDLFFIDLYTAFDDKRKTATDFLLPDKTHLNAAGYSRITPLFRSALKENL